MLPLTTWMGRGKQTMVRTGSRSAIMYWGTAGICLAFR